MTDPRIIRAVRVAVDEATRLDYTGITTKSVTAMMVAVIRDLDSPGNEDAARERGGLRARAASYARDAEALAAVPLDAMSADEREGWTLLYTMVADELRRIAGGAPAEPVLRSTDRAQATLTPDAHLVLDGSNCIVVVTPERRITVGNVVSWQVALGNALVAQKVYDDSVAEASREWQAAR